MTGHGSLPDVDFLVGYGQDRTGHAVAFSDALAGHDEAVVLTNADGKPRRPLATPVCAEGTTRVVVDRTAGRFDHANLALGGPEEPCPACCWIVAAHRGRLGEALERLAVTGPERDVLAAQMLPDLLVRLCRAVLLADETVHYVVHRAVLHTTGEQALFGPPHWEVVGYDEPVTPSPETLDLLAHLCTHAPQVVYRVECLDGDCEHADIAGCAAAGSVICADCSLTAGSWAGEHVGTTILSVPSPCSVVTRAARDYTVTGGYACTFDGAQQLPPADHRDLPTGGSV